MLYKLRWLLTYAVGLFMRWTHTDFRFSKDYRWGITAYHRAVYATICTFGANIVADGRHWPLT